MGDSIRIAEEQDRSALPLWAGRWHESQHRLHTHIWLQALHPVGLVLAVAPAQRWSRVVGAAADGRHDRRQVVATPYLAERSGCEEKPTKEFGKQVPHEVSLQHEPAQGWDHVNQHLAQILFSSEGSSLTSLPSHGTVCRSEHPSPAAWSSALRVRLQWSGRSKLTQESTRKSLHIVFHAGWPQGRDLEIIYMKGAFFNWVNKRCP